MAEPKRITAPFSDEQVKELKNWQRNYKVQPLTCPNRDAPGHIERLNREKGTLVPYRAGWFCLDCDYAQDWAHKFMVDGSLAGDVDAQEAAAFASGEVIAGASHKPSGEDEEATYDEEREFYDNE